MSTYVLTPAPSGSLCQSLTHGVGSPDQVATNIASVMLTPDVIAQVCLCPPCCLELLTATDSAGG